jgi:ABC-type transport system involved in multi-copper enzyme maturation permease subunit
MNKFSAILADSVLEIRDRKIIYLYLIVTVFLLLMLLILPDLMINGENILESDLMSPELVDKVAAQFFSAFFGFLILLLVFGSAGLIPSYLGKGRIELALSKPIGRFRLMSMKFAAVYIIMIAILAIMTISVWAVMSIRLGSVSWNFFWGLLFSFLQFLVVYAIVFLIGVATQSAAAAIMGYFIVRIGAGLFAQREVLYNFLGDSVWKTILDVCYHILPKIGEMADNYVPLLEGRGIRDAYPVYSTIGFAIVAFLGALLIFSRKDY